MNKKIYIGFFFVLSTIAQNVRAMGEEALIGRRQSHEEKVSRPIVHTARPTEAVGGIGTGHAYKPVVYHRTEKRTFTPPLLPLPSAAESGQLAAQKQGVAPQVPPKPNKRLSIEEQKINRPIPPTQPLKPWDFPGQVNAPLSLPAAQARTQVNETRMEAEAKRASEMKQLREKTAQINRALLEKNLPAEQAAFARKEAARSLAQREKLRRKVYGK